MLNSFKNALLVVAIAISIIILATIVSLYLSLPDVTDLITKNPKTTALIDQRIREAQRSHEPYRVRQYWVAFDTIPTLLKDIVRISEDAGFYHHHGIDFTELKEAMKKNWEKGKYARGGSTITQQLAKNLYLSTQKRIFRKIKEYFIAKRLEANLSKDRIFYLYLNVIELGPGIFGVQAASRYYFNKNVSKLDLEEMIRLAAVIPQPLKIDPRGDHRWLQWKTRWILNTLKKYEYISEGEYRSQIANFQ